MLLPAQADGQARFGIVLSAEQSRQLDEQELERLERLGFSILAPKAHFSSEIFATLATRPVEVWPVMPQRFLTRNSSIADAGEQLIFLRRFERLTAFNGIIAAWHADLRAPVLRDELTVLAEILRDRYPAQRRFMVTKGAAVPTALLLPVPDAGLTLPPAPFPDAVLLLPPAPSANEHYFFGNQVREGLRLGYTVFLMDSAHLERYLDDDFSGLAEVISGFRSSANPAIPLPPAERSPQTVNFGIMVLIALWFSFAVHFRFNPNYNRTVGRFFFNHSFLVEDILRRHILLSGSIFVVFVQLVVMWGLFTLSFTQAFLGDAGMKALRYWIPFAGNQAALFVLGLIAGALLNGLLWVWLTLSCFRRNAASMAGTLLFWPMHLGFFLLLALLTMQGAGAGSIPVLIAGLAFLAVQFGSFYVAAAAFGRQPSLKPGVHYAVTVLLYTLLLGGLLTYFLKFSSLYGVFQLGFWLNN